MESLEGVFEIIKADAWMASVDIKDAFFHNSCAQSLSKIL